ncbi:hypothetical protein [Agromyces sp. NPDC058104]|uniref:hypothetical protein n=1 Tax=Agromyces sp. NPDC058104 TaxID=3346342 RepID=UPI0036DC54A2
MNLPAPIQSFLEATSTYTALIWIAALIGLAVFIRKAWPVISKFVKTIDVVLELPDHLKRIEDRLGDQDETMESQGEVLERVRAQVENDHSTNLREEVTEALEWQEKHQRKSDATVALVHEIAAHVGLIEKEK